MASFSGGAGNDSLTGGSDNDTLDGKGGDDTLDGGGGNDTLRGGVGNDLFVVGEGTDAIAELSGGGHDTVRSAASFSITATYAEDITLTGTADINAIGNSMANVLTGNDGNNVLNGMGGSDTMIGGLGDDLFVLDRASDAVTEAADEGNDTLRIVYNVAVVTTIDLALFDHIENLEVIGGGAFRLMGDGQNNVLSGNASANWLDGKAGDDTLAGGAGSDTYFVDSDGDVIVEGASSGTDTVKSSVSLTLGANLEKLTFIGAGGFAGSGNSLNNTITGNGGADTLTGGGGNDTLRGGAGDDLYVMGEGTDVIAELAGGGHDTARSAVSFSIAGTYVEDLTLTGTADIGATGNSMANVLTGNDGNNVLNGMGAADTMIGGLGDDLFVLDRASDVVTEAEDEGSDTVRLAFSVSAPTTIDLASFDHIENLEVTGGGAFRLIGDELANVLTGNASANVLNGRAGNDTLDGKAGIDTMIGGLGDDVFILDRASDVATEAAEEGSDTVRIAYSVSSPTAIDLARFDHVENLEVTGAGTFRLIGDEQGNILSGNASANVLLGGAGNDTLDGKAGIDTMIGGVGDDLFVLDRAADQVIELADEGSDTVHIAFNAAVPTTINLGGNVEDAQVVGTGAFHVTGNAQHNALTGNASTNALAGAAGDDTLDGGAGNDIMSGGAGNDILMGGAGSDTYHFDRLGGSDLVMELAADSGDVDRLVFGPDITPEDLVVTSDELGNLHIAISGSAAALRFNVWFSAEVPSHTERFEFEDGSVLTDAQIEALINDVPTLANPIADQAATEDAPFSFTVPADAFDDPDIPLGDSLSYTASLVDGAALPAWLSFDAQTRLFSGTPADGDVGTISVRVTASDESGLSASDVFDITAANTNDAPVLASAIADQNARDTIAFSFTVPVGTFTDVDAGDSLSYSAILAGGGELPAWLSFDPLTRSFSGTPGPADIGVVNIVVLATDGAGAQAWDLFSITVAQTGRDLIGTPGNDTLSGGSGNDTIDGLEGADSISGLTGDDTLLGGDGDDTLDGGGGNDSMAGGFGNDRYFVDSECDVTEESGSDGNDTVISSLASHVLGIGIENLELASGLANLSGTGNDLNNFLAGNDGHNTLDGGAGNDTLLGGAGNDTLVGGSGANSMAGGQGDDAYFVDVGDVVDEEAEGSGGIDTIVTSLAAYTLGSSLENLSLITSVSTSTGTGNGLDNVISHTGSGDVFFFGMGGADTLTGAISVYRFFGGEGDDLLVGGRSPDTLDGGTGNDTMAGRGSHDRYILDSSGDVVDETLPESGGIDTVLSPFAEYTLPVNVENLELVAGSANLNGIGNELDNVLSGNDGHNSLAGSAGNDTLAGGAGNDSLDGGAGNDFVDGGTGGDTLVGGAGNDRYIVDTGTDIPIESLSAGEGGGSDLVQSAVSYTLGANFDNLTLTGSATAGIGNELANTLLGNNENNELYGLDGNDSMEGSGGNDTLDGGTGTDTMVGGIGNDTYAVDQTSDRVVESAEDEDGHDTVFASESYVLTSLYVEDLHLTGASDISGTGNDRPNVISGNSGANLLSGMRGADTLAGGHGDDVYQLADAATLSLEITAGATVRSSSGYSPDHIFLNSYFGASIAPVDAVTLVVIDFSPSFVSITLSTKALDVALLPGTYTGLQDFPFEAPGHPGLSLGLDGSAIAFAAGSFTVSDIEVDYSESSPELLWLQASFELTALPNSVAGTITFDARSPAPADVIIEEFDQGHDRVETPLSYTIVANVEDLTLTGSGNVRGNGNDLANTIIGNGAANALDGKGGSDTLTGGAGEDHFVFSAVESVDAIEDFTSSEDAILLDSDTFTALAAGALDPLAFVAGEGLANAPEAGQRIVFDTDTGDLYYDADGAGGADAVKFATLNGAPALAASDFEIV